MGHRRAEEIVLSGVSVRFGEKQVLKDFNATFAMQHTTWIMGPSGCGKTTLMQVLMGLLSPDAGCVEGVPAHKSAVFQENRLCETFSAVTNVHMVCGKKWSRAHIEAHLARIGLSDSLHQPVSELSGGMRRRVAIVRAMLAQADVYFLDEPFKGLDEATRGLVIDYVREQTKGKTVIAVTHSREEAALLGGTLYPMPAADALSSS